MRLKFDTYTYYFLFKEIYCIAFLNTKAREEYEYYYLNILVAGNTSDEGSLFLNVNEIDNINVNRMKLYLYE